MGLTNYNVLPPTAYATRGKAAVLSPATGKQMALCEVSIELSATASDMAWGWLLPNALWKAGQWTNSSTTYTEDTTDAQDAGSNDFALTTLTNNDGFIVCSTVPFNMVGFTVTTAVTGSPAYDYNYWNGAWTALPLKGTPGFTATDQWWSWLRPVDWVVTTASAGTDVPVGYYAVRLRATTAPLTAALASVLWVAQFVTYKTNAAQYSKVTTNLENTETVIPAGGGLIPYFATANAGNLIEAKYRELG